MTTTSEFGEKSKMPKPKHPNATPMIIHAKAQCFPKQLYTIKQMNRGKTMTLSLLLYDDNSNSFVVIVVLPNICCSVKWQSMHKTSVSVCMCVHARVNMCA